MGNLIRRGMRFGMFLTVALTVGCGAPDLGAMRPQTWKPSAQVFVIGKVPHWNPSSLDAESASVGVVMRSVYVPPANSNIAVSTAIHRMAAGMVVVVKDAPVDETLLRLADSHLDTRFLFVATASVPTHAVNIEQVCPSPTAPAYVEGWTAGALATGSTGGPPMVWFLKANSASSSVVVKAALAGAYAVNPKVSLKPLQLVKPMPKLQGQVVLVGGKVPPTEWGLLQAQGATVISLSADSTPANSAVAPLVPRAPDLVSDLKSFAHLRWTPGVHYVNSAPFVEVNSRYISQPILASVNTLETAIEADPSIAENGWRGLPSKVKQSLSSLLS